MSSSLRRSEVATAQGSLETWRKHFRFSRTGPSEYLVVRRADNELLGQVERHGLSWTSYTTKRVRIDHIPYTSRRSAADALERHHRNEG